MGDGLFARRVVKIKHLKKEWFFSGTVTFGGLPRPQPPIKLIS
jgi:hypothetical protein